MTEERKQKNRERASRWLRENKEKKRAYDREYRKRDYVKETKWNKERSEAHKQKNRDRVARWRASEEGKKKKKEYLARPDVRKRIRAEALRVRKTTPDGLKRYILTSARGRAREKDIAFNLTIEDITIPTVCPVLGIPLFCGDGKMCDNSYSIDRINLDLGYVKGNVRIISWRANRLRSDATLEESRLIYEDQQRMLGGLANGNQDQANSGV